MLYGNKRKYELVRSNNIDTSTWLSEGIGFSYSKLLLTFLHQYSNTGNVKLSNDKLIELLGNYTERGIQWGMQTLEKEGLITRVFTDETKYHRVGIELNIQAILSVVNMNKKEVARLERGNIAKHIKTQLPAFLRSTETRRLQAELERESNEVRRNILKGKLSELNRQNQEYLEYIDTVAERTMKHDHIETITASDEQITAALKEFAGAFGINIPIDFNN